MVWGINQEEPLISTPFQVNLLDAQNPKFHISGSFKVGSRPQKFHILFSLLKTWEAMCYKIASVSIQYFCVTSAPSRRIMRLGFKIK